jgi:hypothetical protein
LGLFPFLLLSTLPRSVSRVVGIGVIAGDCFEGLAWDTFMRLAFGIVLFVVTVDFVASRRIESYDDTHFYEWNLEISALVL